MKKRMIVSVFLLLLIVWVLTVLVAATDMETYGKKSLQNDLRFSSVVGPGGTGSNTGGTVSVRPFTVTFDANGGTVEPVNKTYRILRGSYGELPTPFREGYAFAGWYTELDSGTQVTSETEIKRSDHTLYAHWAETEIIGSGNCGADGDNVTWTLDSNGTLTVSGTGKMKDFSDNLGYVLSSSHVINIRGKPYPKTSQVLRIHINSGVTHIGNHAFHNCSNLQSVTIPDSVTNIGECSFQGCSNLRNITIPDTVLDIGDGAFRGCDDLSDIYYTGTQEHYIRLVAFRKYFSSKSSPLSVFRETEYEGDKLSDCTAHCSDGILLGAGNCGEDLIWVLDNEKVLTISGTGNMTGYNYNGDGGFTITIGGYKPTIYGRSPTWQQTSQLVIETGVTSIGKNAFRDCINLTSVALPDSVTEIESSAFRDCSALTNFVIPNGVTNIANCSFQDCSGLTDLVIPNGVTSIGKCAFSGCNALSNLIIPDSITSIGVEAFQDCNGLTRLVIPNSVTSIGNNAFACTNLESIVIGDGLTDLQSFSFSSYGKLSHVTIGHGITAIKESAFKDCNALSSVTISDSVTTIGKEAFYACSCLTGVIIPDSVTFIGNNAFTNCSSLTSVTIPDSVTSVGWNVFSGCTGLRNAIVGKGLSSINVGMFSGCSGLISIAIGNNVTSIIRTTSTTGSAFYGCSGLTDVYYAGTEAQWNAISGHDSVPISATIHYESAEPDVPDNPPTEPEKPAVREGQIRFLPYSPGNIYYHYVSESVYVQAIVPNAEGFTKNDVMWIFPASSAPASSLMVQYDSDTKSATASQFRMEADGVYTVTTSDGRSASFTVASRGLRPSKTASSSRTDEPYRFYIGGVASDFTVNKKNELSARFTFYDSTFPEGGVESVEWVSSDAKVLAFDKSGLSSISHAKGGKTVEKLLSYNLIDDVKAYGLSEGTATVTCTVKVGDKMFTDEVQITVYSKERFNLIESCRQWISAYGTYMDKVKNALETYMGTQDEQATIREQADALMKADAGRYDKLVTFYSEEEEKDKDVMENVYYAVAEYLAQETKVNFDFSKINLSGVDATTISTDIVKKVWGMFKPVSYTCTTGSATISLTGMGGAVSNLTISYNDKNIAQMITQQDKIAETITAFVQDLLGLEKNLVHQAYQEMVKEAFGKTLSELANEKVKDALLKQLQKHKPAFLRAGVGDVAEGISNCIGYYQHVKKVMELADASPDELLNAFSSTDTFEFKSDTIENKAVAKAMKGLEKARDKLDEKLEKITGGSAVGEVAYELYHAIFKCPVNITVYDSAGKQVGYVGDDDLWYDEKNIYIEQYGDAKHIYSYVGALKFDVVATEVGTLNCVFEEMSKGEAVGRVNYYEIPLYTGKFLSVETPAEAISDESIAFKSEGTTVSVSESLTAETYETSTVNVTCNVFNEDSGEVWGSGEYVRGDAVSLQAIPESGYVFLGWQNVSGGVVSISPVYEFAARDDITLTAMFAEDKEDADNFGSVAITTANVDKTDGLKIRAAIECSDDVNAVAYCVFYDNNGKMIGLEIKSITAGENDLTFSTGSEHAFTAKLLVLDEQFIPKCDFTALKLS